MQCVDCGSPMESKRENYRYDDCGLPYVVLENVEVSRCPKCGWVEVSIPGIENVHKAIAWHVAKKDTRLTPEEARFLRKYLGFSSADFAEVIGTNAGTVSKWENGVRPMGPMADRLLRMLAVTRDPVCSYPIERLKEIDKTKATPVHVELVRKEGREDNQWEPVNT